jgi:ubiquinone/menaquinone biosynthesis C-methylase UbiE
MDTLLTALRAAAETTRLRILALLARGELTVGELVSVLDQSQPRVSRHLKLMCEAGLLDRVQEGTVVFYRLAEAGVGANIHQALVPLVPAEDDGFSDDLTKLAKIRDERFEKAQGYFRENAASWDEIRSLHVSEEQVEAALLELHGGAQKKRLLDIGTGTGRMLELFAPYFEQALGIDVSRDMLSVARGHLAKEEFANCQVRLGDMYDLGVAADSQDLIIFHQVLHFAEKPAEALKEAARALTNGGAVYVVDFAPHEEEFLRTEHAHRRLGFADDEIAHVGEHAGLACKGIKHLDGGKLRVTLWQFVKDGLLASLSEE